MLSLRGRVWVLVMIVTAVVTTATAWFTYRIAAAHIAAMRAADQQVVTRVRDTLVQYAQRRGSWDGLPDVVSALAEQTDKRIVVTTEAGTPVGGPGSPSPPTGDATVTRVDPHPRLVLTDADEQTAAEVAYVELDAFRTGIRMARCLTAAGMAVTVTPGPNGVPHTAEPATGDRPAMTRCRTAAASTGVERDQDFAAVNACAGARGAGSRTACLQDAFADRARPVGPEPVLVAIGASADGADMPVGPVVGVVAMIMVGAAVGSAFVSRRALRPVDALTRSARRLGAGRPWEPVAVCGDDEVAQLARTFNKMAAALKLGEERQRRMIADVAHELRTPLSTVRSYLEGLIDGIVPVEPALFASLHDEALLQQRLVDDLQDLAQAEAGILAYRRHRLDVGELLETCRTAVAVQADYARVRLLVRVTDTVEVHADADRIRQVVGNLVGNALRHTPAGGVITLSCCLGGGMAVIAVTDTGCGIAADDLPHVFDRFWRADESRDRTTGGSGLGLAIAQQIVSDHGGDITVRSRLEHGTTFTVRLPALVGAGN